VVDGFAVPDKRFQFFPDDIGGNQQLDRSVGSAFLDPMRVWREFGVFMGFGDFVAKKAETPLTQVRDQSFFGTEHKAQGFEENPNVLPNVCCQLLDLYSAC
jgi:hypothetical protein